MGGKKNVRRRKCENKVKYITAEGAATGIDRLREVTGTKDLLTVYLCGFCQHFHFGHPPHRVLKRIARQLQTA